MDEISKLNFSNRNMCGLVIQEEIQANKTLTVSLYRHRMVSACHCSDYLAVAAVL